MEYVPRSRRTWFRGRGQVPDRKRVGGNGRKFLSVRKNGKALQVIWALGPQGGRSIARVSLLKFKWKAAACTSKAKEITEDLDRRIELYSIGMFAT